MSGSGPLREETAHDEKSNALHAEVKRISTHFPQVPMLSCSEFKQIQEDPYRKPQFCLVDVRTADEVSVSIIPGAITQEEFEAKKGELKGKTIVCHCTVGYRSSSFANKLRGQGWEAKNLEGGIVRWSQKRFPLVTKEGGEETKRIHVYGKTWALQPDDYEPVMFKSAVAATLRQFLPSWLGGKK